ncbi:hypothetical protein D915_000207 [Fasciola hepatica]|uniref:Uncharacterized protein n=1 Tax=Fasciola hepatica TaxID=6192 RepID=A0A2H1CWV5_FASHE|nr:hypothetical protein D915_000207 [Fasciola hepatica]
MKLISDEPAEETFVLVLYGEEVDIDHTIIAVFDVPTEVNFAVMLYQNEKYYASSTEVCSPSLKTSMQNEVTQPLTQPLNEPVCHRNLFTKTNMSATTFISKSVTDLIDSPKLIPYVVPVDHVYHGKTCLMNCLIEQTRSDIHARDDKDLR